MLLVSTASFGNTIYTYDGVNPLKKSSSELNRQCSVDLEMINDTTMRSIEISALTIETGGWDYEIPHYARPRTIDFINDKDDRFEKAFPSASEGLVQTSSRNGVITYKTKGTETKVEIKMKGLKIGDIKSLTLMKKEDSFLGKTYTSECNNLVLRSATLN